MTRIASRWSPLIVTVFTVAALQAAPDGAAVFRSKCAMCHVQEGGGRAPAPEALSKRSRRSIMAALQSGTMRVVAEGLTGPERQAVVAFLVPNDTAAADLISANRCSSVTPLAGEKLDLAGWNGWGVDLLNSRYQARTTLNAGNVPKLKLKWAFGIPNADTAYGQPTAVGGRLFFGSADGTVYSLDAATGCTIWTFQADSYVRSAITIASNGPNRYLAYFGAGEGTAYAVNAEDGTLAWKVKVEDHPFARITGAPKLYQDRLYVPVSSLEEVPSGDPQYSCCTFRGSVVALDARSGKQIWKTYTIPEKPDIRGKNKNGVPMYGPAGAAVWNSPTLDVSSHTLYIGTGDAYTGPAAKTSDAILAIDMETGALRWSQQLTGGDGWNFSCSNGNKVNCPPDDGPDVDFGSSPILRNLPNGKRVLLCGQKSGVMHALDPDQGGKILWQTRIGKGSAIGGIMWGSATDGENVYSALSDSFLQRTGGQPGGMFALRIGTGETVWHTPAPKAACLPAPGCSAAQIAAVTLIPGVVFSGSMDGHLRAYSTKDGAILWDFDTLHDFATVNSVKAHGGSMSGGGPTVAGGMMFVGSGYAALGGMGGNVLLAFAPEP
jgi:polyvinyl alcohol dehydrogenase (cytochrome)